LPSCRTAGLAHRGERHRAGRYKLHRAFNLLFMARRSVRSNSPAQVEFMGYLGMQILLSDYGRRLREE
jgi:hypothetical protein